MKRISKSIFLLLFIFQNYSSSGQTELWGVTTNGGDHNQGCIFKTDPDGNNQQVVHSQSYLSARTPMYTQVVEAPTGKLYFVTPHGGTYDGTIMEYDPATGILDTAYNFPGSPDCRLPYGKMFLASNGKFYGLTYAGGSPSSIEPGGVYEFDPATRTYAFKLSFDYTHANRSYSSFVEEPGTGKLYSTTYYGGSVGKGIILEYDFNANTFAQKAEFTGPNGSSPVGELLKASNGKYYGMTTEGGLHNLGIIYEFDLATNILTNKMDFDSITNGCRPYGGFVEPVPGLLYGLATKGGVAGYGVAFKYNINTSAYTKIYDFDLSNTGYIPYGTLIKAADGLLYGNTFSGPDIYHSATLFKIDPSTDSLSAFFSFQVKTTGTQCTGSLMQASNGKLYGLSTYGTEYNQGSFFSFDLSNGSFSLIAKLDSRLEGKLDYSGVIQASNGLLYGVCKDGGFGNAGVIYEINPFTYAYRVVFNFDLEWSNTTGKWPVGRLCQPANGKLYGTCPNGGSTNNGTIFSFDLSNGTYHLIHDCIVSSDGRYPTWNMVEAPNGKLYSPTRALSSIRGGVMYEVDPANDLYQVRATFDSSTGEFPSGELLRSSTGRLFGLTVRGGAIDSGSVYEFIPATNSLVLQASFTGGNSGRSPVGSLIEASNGKFYGYAGGGSHNKGIIFEWDLAAQSINKIFDFDGTATGYNANGALLQSSNGKLYGVTTNGGDSSVGIFFEYDLSTSMFTKKFDFTWNNGAVPYTHKLLEVNPTTSVPDIKNEDNLLHVLPSVSSGRFDVYAERNNSWASLEVTDVAGKIVYHSSKAGNHCELKFENFSPGVYFVKAKINNSTCVKRIIKQ